MEKKINHLFFLELPHLSIKSKKYECALSSFSLKALRELKYGWKMSDRRSTVTVVHVLWIIDQYTMINLKANILENRSRALYITKEALASKPIFGEASSSSSKDESEKEDGRNSEGSKTTTVQLQWEWWATAKPYYTKVKLLIHTVTYSVTDRGIDNNIKKMSGRCEFHSDNYWQTKTTDNNTFSTCIQQIPSQE